MSLRTNDPLVPQYRLASFKTVPVVRFCFAARSVLPAVIPAVRSAVILAVIPACRHARARVRTVAPS
jgi:hypothetical protein